MKYFLIFVFSLNFGLHFFLWFRMKNILRGAKKDKGNPEFVATLLVIKARVEEREFARNASFFFLCAYGTFIILTSVL